MTEFNELKSQWETQQQIDIPKNGPREIIKKINFIKREQRITNAVLITTTIGLIAFFFYISAYNNVMVTLGLLLMIGTLLVRIVLEYVSIKQLNLIDVTESAKTFKEVITKYYKRRINIHYAFTPMIIITYILGFIMLLPSFKENLSSGFYTYIKISAILFLLVLVFLIRRQIINELNILKQINT